MWKSTLVSILFLLPILTYAAGLVPCGGVGEPMCQSCHVLQLIQIVMNWLVGILTTITAIIIAYAGLRLVISVGNASAMQQAKSLISNCLIGFAIVLSGWLLIDLVLKSMVNDQVYGVWNELQCVDQPVSRTS
ncbi:MAG TPA: hypothetical protein PKA42_01305 [Candidatus Paceibacterota bacterium]|mgnify:CR=1 FL=1|nr:hypothetical protein [Candidatus Paceibacterota bacterium]HMO82780.1 hypothetical protein [Candidatus Paceibacterota bacterium]